MQTDAIPARVHEPLSVLDALEINRPMHSWSLDASLKYIAAAGPRGRRAAQLRRKRSSSWSRSLTAWPHPPKPPSAAAWTCAPTALARRYCVRSACTA